MPGFMKIEDPTETEQRWKEIDAWGHRLAGKKGEMDVEIGEWLMAARKEEVHRRFAYGSLHEYAERRIGLEPHSIGERLRVAEALVGLPLLREALRQGKHCWSAIRELTRVVVPETEETWLEATDGMRAQDVGRMVSGRRPGQLPDDPADPAQRPHVLRFEVSAESFALFREALRRGNAAQAGGPAPVRGAGSGGDGPAGARWTAGPWTQSLSGGADPVPGLRASVDEGQG